MVSSTANSDLNVKGNLTVDGDVKIDGKSIGRILSSIEDRLAILHPNIELEERWENLRKLRESYVELEREIIEQEKMWKILKK